MNEYAIEVLEDLMKGHREYIAWQKTEFPNNEYPEKEAKITQLQKAIKQLSSDEPILPTVMETGGSHKSTNGGNSGRFKPLLKSEKHTAESLPHEPVTTKSNNTVQDDCLKCDLYKSDDKVIASGVLQLVFQIDNNKISISLKDMKMLAKRLEAPRFILDTKSLNGKNITISISINK